MNNVHLLQTVRISFVIIMLICQGCATTRPKANLSFVSQNTESLTPGMTVVQIETIFGQPDTTYTMKLGKDVDQKWEGLVYKYYTIPDPAYQHAKRRLTNTFVFFNGTDPPLLNNWEIEHLYDVELIVPEQIKEKKQSSSRSPFR